MMSYAPMSAGHTAKEAPRDIEQETIDELVEKAEEFLADKHHLRLTYARAITMVQGIRTTANAAGLLALRPELHHPLLGHLISALWNECCQEKIIVYKHDTSWIYRLGYKLPSQKAFIMRGAAGLGTTDDAQGPIIVQGSVRGGIGANGRSSVVRIEPAACSTGSHINVSPEAYAQNVTLKAYVERLVAAATEDPVAAERTFGDGKAIRKAIRNCLRSTAQRSQRAQ